MPSAFARVVRVREDGDRLDEWRQFVPSQSHPAKLVFVKLY